MAETLIKIIRFIVIMTITPQDAADKFAAGWIAAKPRAIAQYAAVASTLAQKAIDNQTKLLTNFTKAVQDGKWADGLRKYVGNKKMENLYTDKLNSITTITAAEKMKIEASVQLKQYLQNQLAAVIVIFKAAQTGAVGVPTGISDVGLKQLIMSGIISQESALSSSSTPQAIYAACSAYMGTHYGFPTVQ